MTKRIAADEVLVAEVLGGDREAFRGLIERYLPMVQSIGIARGRNASDVDDMAQETFIKAFGAWGRCVIGRDLRLGWLRSREMRWLQVATRRCGRRQSRRSRRLRKL